MPPIKILNDVMARQLKGSFYVLEKLSSVIL